jgi:transposase
MSAQGQPRDGQVGPAGRAEIAASAFPLRANQQRLLRMDNGVWAALPVLLAARDHMTSERTATVNALIALFRVLNLGIDARQPLTGKQLAEISRWRCRTEAVEMVISRAEAVRCATRVLDLDQEPTSH